MHFRVFEVNASHLIELVFVEHDKLLDDYPLVGTVQIVSFTNMNVFFFRLSVQMHKV